MMNTPSQTTNSNIQFPKRPYDKKSLTFAEQLDQLEIRGMVFKNKESTLKLFEHINYYRLEAYWYSYYKDPKNEHIFSNGTCFSYIWRDYRFDRELRELISHALEKIEISFRTQFVYYLSQYYGPFPIKKKNFSRITKKAWDQMVLEFKKNSKNSKEVFAIHLMGKYDIQMLPIWALAELMSFGKIFTLFSNLDNVQLTKDIKAIYDLDARVFNSWMGHLRIVRNFCAHHSRLWNRRFITTPPLPKLSAEIPHAKQWISTLNEKIADNPHNDRRLYNTIIMIDYLLLKISPKNRWRFDIVDVIKKYKIDTLRMGFPQGWEDNSFWKKS